MPKDYRGTLLPKDTEGQKVALDLLKKINQSQGAVPVTVQESFFPRWDDVRGIGSVRTAGANIPGFNIYRGAMRAWEFDNSLREIWVRIQLPHRYKEGTKPRFHVHFFHASAVDNGAVVWQAEITVYNGKDGVKPVPVIVQAPPVQILGADQYKELIADFGEVPFDCTELKISGMIEYRLFRDPGFSTDTSTASVWLDETDAHFETDSNGSRTEYTKGAVP